MVDRKCRAKDPSKCPYHGAVMRMDKAEAELLVYVAQKKPIPSSLYAAYAEAKQQVEAKESEGWDEAEFASLWGGAATSAPVAVKPASDTTPSDDVLSGSEVPVKTSSNEKTEQKEFIPDSNSSLAVRKALPKVKVMINDQPVTFIRGDFHKWDRVPKYVRFQFHKPLKKSAQAEFTSILRYSFKSSFGVGSEAKFEVVKSDSGYSFVVSLDELKEKKDYQAKLREFGRQMKEYVENGTPKRPTRNDTRRYEKVSETNAGVYRLYFAFYED